MGHAFSRSLYSESHYWVSTSDGYGRRCWVHTGTGEIAYQFINVKPGNPIPRAVVPPYGMLVHPAPPAYGMLPPAAPHPSAFQGYGGVAVAPYCQHQTCCHRPPSEQPLMLVWR